MRILVTGRRGQLATALREHADNRGHELIALGRPQFELAADASAVVRAIAEVRPDAIIAAAAYTAVDAAETDRATAEAVNVHGAAAVAQAASKLGVPLIHLSTDYIFDGTKAGPYVEEDSPDPLGVYGGTKLGGEQAVLSLHANTAVVRTAWVYSPFGANFVKTMLRLAADRDEIRVVADQYGNPTSALDLAGGVMTMAERLQGSAEAALRGIFHMTGFGEASWAEFASAIFAASIARGGPHAKVLPIATSDYPTPAPRPANSRLDCTKLRDRYGISLPAWETSVALVVERLLGSGPNKEELRA